MLGVRDNEHSAYVGAHMCVCLCVYAGRCGDSILIQFRLTGAFIHTSDTTVTICRRTHGRLASFISIKG